MVKYKTLKRARLVHLFRHSDEHSEIWEGLTSNRKWLPHECRDKSDYQMLVGPLTVGETSKWQWEGRGFTDSVFLWARAEPGGHRLIWVESRMNAREKETETLSEEVRILHQDLGRGSPLDPTGHSWSNPARSTTWPTVADGNTSENHSAVCIQDPTRMTVTFRGYILASGLHRGGKEGPGDLQSQRVFKLQTQCFSLTHIMYSHEIVCMCIFLQNLKGIFYIIWKYFIHG